MYVFVVNPISGNGRGSEVWQYIQKRLMEERVPYYVFFTKAAHEATEKVKEIIKQIRPNAVVAIGGDGTVHEVGNALVKTQIPLGFIPAGTGNDFALAHQIPMDIEWAFQRILRHQAYWMDTADLGGKRMIGFMGSGFDGKVAKVINESKRKRWLGRLTYGIEALRTLKTFKPERMVIQIDDQTVEYDNVWFIAVANIPNYAGGMKICPQAQMDDGWLDICLVRDLDPKDFVRVFPTVYQGKHIHHPSVVFHRGKKIELLSDSGFISHVDGEIYPEKTWSIQILPKSLMVL